MNFVSRSLVLFACISACASAPNARPAAPPLTPSRLYPLRAGGVWSYDVDPGDGSNVLAITRVIESDSMHALVQGGEGTTRYELRDDGIFRSERGGYLLKAPITVGAQWPSGGGTQATVRAIDLQLETPAGRFSGCVEVIEQGAPSGATISTMYCPEVGPVQVISSMDLTLGGRATVRVTARLRGYSIEPPISSATVNAASPDPENAAP
jgi:hypothetical protein